MSLSDLTPEALAAEHHRIAHESLAGHLTALRATLDALECRIAALEALPSQKDAPMQTSPRPTHPFFAGLVALCLVLGLSQAVYAQPRLPDEVLQVLAEECDARPGPMPSGRAFGDLLHAVAARTSHLGIGVSRKTGGHRVDSPVGDIAEDVLCRRPGFPDAGHHWDVIAGAGIGRPLACGGGPSIGVMRDASRPCIAAAATGTGGVVSPPPVVDGGLVTPPPPVPAVDVSALVAEIAALRTEVAALRSVAHGARLEAAGAHESTYRLIAEVVVAEHLDDIKRRIDALAQQVANQPRPTIRLPW